MPTWAIAGVRATWSRSRFSSPFPLAWISVSPCLPAMARRWSEAGGRRNSAAALLAEIGEGRRDSEGFLYGLRARQEGLALVAEDADDGCSHGDLPKALVPDRCKATLHPLSEARSPLMRMKSEGRGENGE